MGESGGFGARKGQPRLGLDSPSVQTAVATADAAAAVERGGDEQAGEGRGRRIAHKIAWTDGGMADGKGDRAPAGRDGKGEEQVLRDSASAAAADGAAGT